MRGGPIGWVPTCLQGMFLIFLKGMGVELPSSSHCSHQVPTNFLLFLSMTHQNLFVFIKFPNSSHQFPLVPINNSSKSFCSYQVPIKFLPFPSTPHCSHKLPINFPLFPSTPHCSHQLPINFSLFPTQPYINPHKALNFGIKFCFCNLETWLLR